MDRPALLPLQQPGCHRRAVGRKRPASHHGGRSQDSSLGLLRSRLSPRSDRQPVQIQDGAGALPGAARGNEAARRPDPTHVCDGSGRVDRPLHAPRTHARERLVVPHAEQPGVHDPFVADAGVSAAHGAVDVPRRAAERSALAITVLLAGRLHAALARGRDLGVGRHRHAQSREHHGRRCAQLPHEHSYRP